MPRVKFTKTAIDALPVPKSDTVYWDAAAPGFGVKVTPTGHKVFIVLYRTGGAGSKLRKYTIGPYGRMTLHQARVAAQKVFAARLEGRDPAAERREVHATQVWGYVRLTRHLRRRRNNRSPFRVVWREASLHSYWQISIGPACGVSRSRMAAFRICSTSRGRGKP